MKFKVLGTQSVSVYIEVEADDEESAIDAAYNIFGGLTGYVGNGGTGKLVGTSLREVDLEPNDDLKFEEAEPQE